MPYHNEQLPSFALCFSDKTEAQELGMAEAFKGEYLGRDRLVITIL